MENPSKLCTLEVRLYTEHENASFSGLLDASSRHQWSSCVLLTAQVTNHNPLHILSNSQEDMGHQNSGARAPELWCPFKLKQVFCFNLKNGLQEYQFLFFPKCIYVFLTFPGFIGTLPA